MRSFLAFFKKELLEAKRSGNLLLLGILFLLFGMMNPAIAKLTPWLMEVMSESLAESGMTVTNVTVNALTSWTQFFKNIPMALIVFLLIYSSCFTKEYQRGTLIPVLTKGIPRKNVLLAKSAVMLLIWTAGYWLCFGVTYAYTDYFWDQSILQNLMQSGLGWWFFGVWTIAVTVFFSTLGNANATVLLGLGGTILASYLISLIPKAQFYCPTALTGGAALLVGGIDVKELAAAYAVTLATTCLCFGISLPIFRKKQL